MVLVAVITIVGNVLVTRRKGQIDLDLERFKSAQQENKDFMERTRIENRELRHKSKNQEQQIVSLSGMLETTRRGSEDRQAQINELRKEIATLRARQAESRVDIEVVKVKADQATQTANNALKGAEKASDQECP